MTVIGICGAMGTGKTLSAVFLSVLNKYKHGKIIFSNIDLGFPYYRVGRMEQVEKMHGGETGGFFLGDELWKWCDARRSASRANKLISMILGASRKRGVDICFTQQYFKQVDIRLRAVTDLWAVPYLDDSGICRLEIFDADFRTYVETKRFPAQAIFPLYNTNEEVRDLDEKAMA